MCMVYSSACGAQLIHFSYATNMSHPQESGYMQATYIIPFDTTARNEQHVRVVQ